MQNQTTFPAVKQAWQRYIAEKKAAQPVVENVTQAMARKYAQMLSQEISVLEFNLSQYRAVQRRARPSMNSRVSKTIKENIDTTIKMMQRYISHYEDAYKSWKRLVKAVPKKRRVSMFQLTTNMGPKFVDRVSGYIKAQRTWIERETMRKENRPILPLKTNTVNVRKMTINQAKNVKSVAQRLKQTTQRANALTRDIERAKYNMAVAADNKTRATKKWRQAEAAMKKVSTNVHTLKKHQAENVNFYIGQITHLQNRLTARGREAENAKLKAERLSKLLVLAEQNRGRRVTPSGNGRIANGKKRRIASPARVPAKGGRRLNSNSNLSNSNTFYNV